MQRFMVLMFQQKNVLRELSFEYAPQVIAALFHDLTHLMTLTSDFKQNNTNNINNNINNFKQTMK